MLRVRNTSGFIVDFRKRLSSNTRLHGHPLTSTNDIDVAIRVLDKHADEVVVSTASAVFLITAVLQSGKLDALVVVAMQTRLIWSVAHVYYQRPLIRDFLQLYATVASTVFIAVGIEDVDVDVLVTTIFGSTAAAIPGKHILAEAVLSGSANAFLTLRVGMITKEYCRCTSQIKKSGLRRAATLQAAKLLGNIVQEGTAKLSRAVTELLSQNNSARDFPLVSCSAHLHLTPDTTLSFVGVEYQALRRAR